MGHRSRTCYPFLDVILLANSSVRMAERAEAREIIAPPGVPAAFDDDGSQRLQAEEDVKEPENGQGRRNLLGFAWRLMVDVESPLTIEKGFA